MDPRRTAPRVLAWALAACVLFAHTAAIAYACVRATDRAEAATFAEAPCPAHASSAQQEGPTAENANLCEVHCQAGSLPDSPTVVPTPMAALTYPASAAASLTTPAVAAPPAPRGAGPPPPLQHARLLI